MDLETSHPARTGRPLSTAMHELSLDRLIAAPRAHVFRVWTTRLPDWWGPHGMTTPVCELDLRPGGTFRTVLRAPDGTEYSTCGVFLEIVPHERIVFTDAYVSGWLTTPRPFLTVVVGFEDAGMGTLVTVRARHWSDADRAGHERIGFHVCWGESLDRLAAVATRPA